MSVRARAAAVASGVGLLAVVAGCGEGPGGSAAGAAGPPPAVVTVSRPIVREVVDWDEFPGRLEAVEAVEVRARVNGYLEAIHFRDGDLVERGDPLFTIDPRPYLAVRDRAAAQLEQARAQLELARRELTRSAQLVRRNAETQEEYDIKASRVRQAEADVAAAEAALEAAELDVEFCEVRAPISGRIGRHLVTVGNLINGEMGQSTLLATIVSLDPIHVYFDATERDHLKYQRLARAGSRPSAREGRTPIAVRLADEEDFAHRGAIDFVDNRIDAFTATMRGRGVLPNPDHLLTPGLFAKVRIPGSGRYRALLLPDGAIVRDQVMSYAFVVEQGGVPVRRRLELGPSVAGFRVVRSGIGPEDLVVVKGLQSVRDGVPVVPEEEPLVLDEELWARKMPIEEFFPPGDRAGEGAAGAAPGGRAAS